jgi:Arc/MetJ-type ribon-helix-helix transcriptional regulator
MTQITVNLPTKLQHYLDRKVQEGYGSAESFMLALVESCELQESRAAGALEQVDATARTALEDILEKRSQGPFVPLREGWKQRVMKKAPERVSPT